MLSLPRKSSIQVELYEAILRRGILSVEEQSMLKEQLWRLLRGLDGEQRADRFWEEIQLEGDQFLFHNFETLNRVGFTHQMDTVFICPRFVLVLELKHIAGEITYDRARHQLLRTLNGEVKALGDPFHQVIRHAEWLEHFLWEIGVRGLPVISAVVVTTTSSLLKDMPTEFHVFKLEGLRFKLRDWYSKYPVKVDRAVLTHIRDELLKRHSPRKWKVPIDNLKLRRGVICECGLQMTYHYGVFKCDCGACCRDGFQRGLADYRILVDEWITNRDFREFFGVDDPFIVSKLFKRLNLKYEGSTKNRRYYIPEGITSYQLYKRGRRDDE